MENDYSYFLDCSSPWKGNLIWRSFLFFMHSINWLTFDVPILEVNILDVNIVTNMSKVWKPDVVIAHIVQIIGSNRHQHYSTCHTCSYKDGKLKGRIIVKSLTHDMYVKCGFKNDICLCMKYGGKCICICDIITGCETIPAMFGIEKKWDTFS